MKLNLACGKDYRFDCVNLDFNKLVKADVYHDLELLPLPFESNCFNEIFCIHILEHLNPKLIPKLMEELYRILKKNGVLVIEVPFVFSHYAWSDPTHFRGYTIESFNYFCVGHLHSFYSNASFVMRKRFFKALGKSFLARFSVWLANLHFRFYERSFLHFLFPVDAVVVELKKETEVK